MRGFGAIGDGTTIDTAAIQRAIDEAVDRRRARPVRVTQVGSGEFHNLTHGSVRELVNPSIRTLGFSPDGSLVTFWVRKPSGPAAT